MGINTSAVKVFLHESRRRGLLGRLLTLGRQDVYLTADELRTTMAEFGKRPVQEIAPSLSKKVTFAKSNFISDEYLFSALGFTECKALDASSYEEADFVFDLNRSDPPASLVDRWDTVFDGGTTEHVFHLPNALSNIFRFLRIGGRVIHIAPSSNHIDHGFYMFSPTLFWDYYKANNFEINVCQVFRYTQDLYAGAWQVCDYVPGGLTRVSMGGLDDALYGVILIATKTPNSTFDVIPQQGLYADNLWQSKSADVADALDPNFSGKGLGLRTKYLL
jgi:SAM-dependent methyltransferase